MTAIFIIFSTYLYLLSQFVFVSLRLEGRCKPAALDAASADHRRDTPLTRVDTTDPTGTIAISTLPSALLVISVPPL